MSLDRNVFDFVCCPACLLCLEMLGFLLLFLQRMVSFILLQDLLVNFFLFLAMGVAELVRWRAPVVLILCTLLLQWNTALPSLQEAMLLISFAWFKLKFADLLTCNFFRAMTLWSCLLGRGL